jgi:hypothetical protein
MSSVLMTEPTIVKGGKAKEQQHKDDICAQVLQRLMMQFHRVVLLGGCENSVCLSFWGDAGNEIFPFKK